MTLPLTWKYPVSEIKKKATLKKTYNQCFKVHKSLFKAIPWFNEKKFYKLSPYQVF